MKFNKVTIIFKIYQSEPCTVNDSLMTLKKQMQQVYNEGWKVISHTWVTSAEYYDGYYDGVWNIYTEKIR